MEAFMKTLMMGKNQQFKNNKKRRPQGQGEAK